MQPRIPLIKLFTISTLTLAHLGTFSPLLRQNVKLYEIRGSSGTQALTHQRHPKPQYIISICKGRHRAGGR